MMEAPIMTYDSRQTTSAPVQRSVMAQQYGVSAYTMAPINNMSTAPHFPPYTSALPPPVQAFQDNTGNFNSSPTMGNPSYKPPFERPGLRIVTPKMERRDPRFLRDGHPISRSPSIKSESSNVRSGGINPSLTAKTITSNVPIGDNNVDFNTDVDALMKTIQSKKETEEIVKKAEGEAKRIIASQSTHFSPMTPKTPGLVWKQTSPISPPCGPALDSNQDEISQKTERKRFKCDIEGCNKKFSQNTHLVIHKRAHTGDKPYTCRHTGCDRKFSQLGNLKTHERRHTGEKPFQCDICGKRFAQRGNVRAHKFTHNQDKPYICKLENCSKDFTQLGNLKSHQNKFHAQALKELTLKFANLDPDGANVSEKDREIWEYFATLYKNSNKGIKGRGKDRKVGPPVQPSHHSAIPSQYPVQPPPPRVHHHPQQTHTNLHHPASLAHYSMSRNNQPTMMGNYNPSVPRDGPQPYEIFDVDTASHAPTSSTNTVYEDHSRDLTFGDRIY